jgi:hypothetical protein
MSAPTAEQFAAAEKYALSKMCTDIPAKKLGTSGYTKWDSTEQKCRITPNGCNASPLNPFSRIPYNSVGSVIDYKNSESNSELIDFWKYFDVEHLVMKKVSADPNKLVCARANTMLKRWCEFPETRTSKGDLGDYGGKGYAIGPGFSYRVVNGVETCKIGKDYCDFKGVGYDDTENKETCYVPDGQQFGEFLVGTTMVRGLNSL